MKIRRLSGRSGRMTRSRITRSLGALAVTAVTGGGLLAALPATAHAQTLSSPHPYSFTTIDNPADPTFNQLLGINGAGVIAGYFGSGATGHPNMGYTLTMHHGQPTFTNENFPGSVQTQVIGINKNRDTVGFWIAGSGATFGFVDRGGIFSVARNPNTPMSATEVNQLLGINDSGIAVGFYNDATGAPHPYKYNVVTGKYTSITVPGAVSAQATGINSQGDVVGLATTTAGATEGWLLSDHHVTAFEFQGSTNTQALGVNDNDQIVGSYVDGAGATHGFVLSHPGQHASWRTVDDPNGLNNTVVNGLNDSGHLVGFYVDHAGNTDGFVASR